MTASAAGAPLIWFPGVGWDQTIGTDRRIVEEIARRRTVVWIDPPTRTAWRGWLRGSAPAIERIGNVIRMRVPATIGVTRWPTRTITDLLRSIALRRALSLVDSPVIVVANPIARLPRGGRHRRVLYVTDDWVSGAPLMGLSAASVAKTLALNAERADAIAAVTPVLVDAVQDARADALTRAIVLPNGAPSPVAAVSRPRAPIAGLVGQLNERLDVDLLEALVAAGVPLRVVGPLVVREAGAERRLRALLDHPLVDWRGAVAAAEVDEHLGDIAVGLTPYTRSPFNVASSPLKTLEYLAHGVPVVSSDLPASRWLGSASVAVTNTAEEFVAAARGFVEARHDSEAERERRAFAQRHSWAARAQEMLALTDDVACGDRLVGVDTPG